MSARFTVVINWVVKQILSFRAEKPGDMLAFVNKVEEAALKKGIGQGEDNLLLCFFSLLASTVDR